MKTLSEYGGRLVRSIWLFPLILTLLLILMAGLKISGSSIGIYHGFFYGEGAKDENLLLNHPQGIRSDEWLVNTQMTLAQANNNFAEVNKNIGDGEDMSMIVDVPYKDWSVIFRPQDLAFFVMPFDNAFAFRWWFMAYLLVMSCYFFVLALLPKKRLVASVLAVGLLLNPFLQWWYLYGTLSVIYYSLFGAVILMKIVEQKALKPALWWAALLAYVTTCFILILYPPFQIACAIVIAGFAVGYLIEKLGGVSRRIIIQKLLIVLGAIGVAGVIAIVFFAARLSIVNTVQNSAYPGHRLQQSGGFDFPHLFSGHLQLQFEYRSRPGTIWCRRVGSPTKARLRTSSSCSPSCCCPASTC